MEFFAFNAGAGERVGVRDGALGVDLSALNGHEPLAPTLAAFGQRLTLADVLRAEAFDPSAVRARLTALSQERRRLCRLPDDIRYLAPVPRPRQVVNFGLVYDEASLERRPLCFLKGSHTVIGPGEKVLYKSWYPALTPEVELAFVIGKGGRNIPESDAGAHVAGYMVANDVTVRYVDAPNPWFDTKCAETLCPTGPWLVPFEEMGPRPDLAVTTRINDKGVARGSTAGLVFSIPFMVHYLSTVFALAPTDVVLTSCPTPLHDTKAGDTMQVEIERLGALTSPVVAETGGGAAQIAGGSPDGPSQA